MARTEILDWLEVPADARLLRAATSTSASTGWAESGGQGLTAHAGHPPGDVSAKLAALAAVLESLTSRSATPVSIPGPSLISQREALCTEKHTPTPGRTLRGNGSMVEAADGWFAVTLARETDGQLVPALTDGAVDDGDLAGWERWARDRPRAETLERCHLLGLAAGAVPSPSTGRSPAPLRPWSEADLGPLATSPGRRLVVADLSSLWAGPLAASLLGEAGAHVLRIESESRPDVPPARDIRFFTQLNGAKDHVVLDFRDHVRLQRVVGEADIVVLSARPRALAQLGLERRPGQLWIAITGYGSDPRNAHRIGFGDDAAATAGAVSWHDGRPNFCADALADPLTGLLAATVAMGFVARQTSARVDLSLIDTVRWAISEG